MTLREVTYFTAQFTGAIAGSALSGALMKKLGVMPVLAAGYGGLAVATATLAFSPWLAGVIAIATLGFSLGLTNLCSLSVATSRLSASRSASSRSSRAATTRAVKRLRFSISAGRGVIAVAHISPMVSGVPC